ncbi:MAG TPA: leucyl/phenylalanyl-tRNA--protein transferase [Thauera sp.]|jgi:leucyl/phenylalanyl-tRNA--protein transferase|nr:leucyl/phenylalanyl-tRNA--protein transferase [Thauera sp.]HRA79942.1 leucyl/phenylalanyl-tRNA--protein transferase [Thauera sp.]
MIPWLNDAPGFPPVEQALTEPNGLLAAGGGLTPEWLLVAYRQGIFPWFSAGEPILWWSPDPRLVLVPAEIRISRSLRKTLRRQQFEVSLDTAFDAVVGACAAPRAGGQGTWITPEIRDAYLRMHELGHAHSVECWRDGQLVGGLYGIALGRVFFGESMFSIETDASKVALAHLARFLSARAYVMIDCQMKTAHLMSMGAQTVSRQQFGTVLARHACSDIPAARWPADATRGIDWSK